MEDGIKYPVIYVEFKVAGLAANVSICPGLETLLFSPGTNLEMDRNIRVAAEPLSGFTLAR